MDNYEILCRIGEGAHGIVLKARNRQSGKSVALKKVTLKKFTSIPVQMLREIKCLQELDHENIVRLREVFAHGSGLVLVFDYMLTDLSQLIKDFENPLTPALIKTYFIQLLYGVAFMHQNSIMHRDLKPANLLINSAGILKIADMGQARLFFKGEDRPYSHQVATRWYRAPELLFGSRNYTEAVDLWSVGCIFGEMFNGSALFPGENDIEQIVCVFQALGTPSEETWPGLTALPDYAKISFPEYQGKPLSDLVPDSPPAAVGVLAKFIAYEPRKRQSAEAVLADEYFFAGPLPIAKGQLPKPRERNRSDKAEKFDPHAPFNADVRRFLKTFPNTPE